MISLEMKKIQVTTIMQYGSAIHNTARIKMPGHVHRVNNDLEQWDGIAQFFTQRQIDAFIWS